MAFTGGDYRVGRLRERIAIEVPEDGEVDEQTGESVRTWVRVWDGLPSGFTERVDEVEQANKNTAIADGEFVIRYRFGISERARVVMGDRVFELVGRPVDRDGRRRFLVLRVRETE